MERKKETKPTKVHSEKKLVGIRGWLLFFTVAFIWTCWMNISDLVLYGQNYLYVGGTILYTMLIIVSALNFVGVICIFKKSKHASKIIIIYLGAIVFMTGYMVMLDLTTAGYGSLLKDIIVSSIWTTYFLKSKRVKNTLVY